MTERESGEVGCLDGGVGRPAISMTERKRLASLMRVRGRREGLRSVDLEGCARGLC